MFKKTLLERARGKIFKVLPVFEQSGDWELSRDVAVVELQGCSIQDERISKVVCKLRGLDSEISPRAFRSVILRCSSIISEVLADEDKV